MRISQIGIIWNKSKSFRTTTHKLKNRSIRRLEKLNAKFSEINNVVKQELYEVNQIKTELQSKRNN